MPAELQLDPRWQPAVVEAGFRSLAFSHQVACSVEFGSSKLSLQQPQRRCRRGWRLIVAAAWLLASVLAGASRGWASGWPRFGVGSAPRSWPGLVPVTARRALDAAKSPSRWRAGPGDVFTGEAQQALYLLRENRDWFEMAVDASLQALQRQRDAAHGSNPSPTPPPSNAAVKDALVLGQRIAEVRAAERAKVVTELLYLKVCERFLRLQVPLIPPLKGGGIVQFGSLDLKGLTTDVYSQDALELVREHLFGMIGHHQGMTSQFMASFATVQIALFQVGQVYAMSAIFGYNLRRLDARFQLEKLAQAGSRDIETDGARLPFLEGEAEEDVESLKEYIRSLGHHEFSLKNSMTSMSLEAYKTLEHQVVSLFGNMHRLKEKLIRALGRVQSPEEATRQLEAAIHRGDVESIRITVDHLRRLVLEAVAFGALLSDSEKEVDSLYELTPAAGRAAALMGDEESGRFLPG